ncbi:hypothetical protein PENSPDRAFT_754182 [Peniophora sp. CONT]|nr:hypothetical protein PENSPDRAFT_754182 [Peniophora sp. CONT]
MPSSPYSSALYAAIVASAIFAFQQIRSHFNITSLSILLVAFSVARARFDLFLIGAFLLVCCILFRSRQPACAASTTNPTTCPVQESPSDVESLSNSSTNPEGGLESGTGVVAGNLAALREPDHPCPVLREYDWLNDPDNLQSNDPACYYRGFVATNQAGPPHSHPAPRPRRKPTAPPASTSFTPHKVATTVPPPPNPKREKKGRWSRSRDEKHAQPTSDVADLRPSSSMPSIGQLPGLSAQQVQDRFYLRHMEILGREADENLRYRVKQNILADTLREMQHLFESMSIGLLSSFMASQYPAVRVSQAAPQYQDVETPMDVDIANADIVYGRMDQDEPRQYACAFGQTSSPFAPQHSPFSSQSSLSHSLPRQPFASAFGQTSPPAFAFGQSSSQSTFASVAQPAVPVQPPQSTPFRATAQPPTPAFAQSHARDQQQQREAQLQAQREEERRSQRLALQQEQQRRANLEAQAWVSADAERQRREKEAERLAAEEQRKKEDSAKERARISAKMRSSIRTEKPRAQAAEEMPKPAKKVTFADENAPPTPAFSAPSQTSSSAPTSQVPVTTSPAVPSSSNPVDAAYAFIAGMEKTFEAVEIEDPNQFPDAPDEGEETEVDDFAQAKTVKQAQGELDEPEGFEEMAKKILANRRMKAADFF